MKQLLIDLLFVALGVMICAPALPVFTSGVALAKITNSAQATAIAPTAGWSIINLLLALGCLGIFFMNVVSWSTLIIADKTTIILTGVLILNAVNYFLRDKEPHL